MGRGPLLLNVYWVIELLTEEKQIKRYCGYKYPIESTT